jgi:hypothetical protein
MFINQDFLMEIVLLQCKISHHDAKPTKGNLVAVPVALTICIVLGSLSIALSIVQVGLVQWFCEIVLQLQFVFNC